MIKRSCGLMSGTASWLDVPEFGCEIRLLEMKLSFLHLLSVRSPALFPLRGQWVRGREKCCAHSRCSTKTRTITSIVLFYFFLPATFPRESVWSRVAKQNETMGFRIWRPISYPNSSHFLPKSQLPRLFSKTAALLPKLTLSSWFYTLNISGMCLLLQTLSASPFLGCPTFS